MNIISVDAWMFCQGFASTSEPLGKRLLALLETDVIPSPLSLPSLERFRGALRLLYCHDNRYAHTYTLKQKPRQLHVETILREITGIAAKCCAFVNVDT